MASFAVCQELLQRYLKLADELVYSKSPQDVALKLQSEPQVQAALHGLHLVARHSLGHLMASLQAWRISSAEAAQGRFGVKAVAHRALVDLLFLLPSRQLLEEVGSSVGDAHDDFCMRVQELCFKWLLEEGLPPELSHLNTLMVQEVTATLGAVSQVSLRLVADPFHRLLLAAVNPGKASKSNFESVRAQVLRLCVGLKSVTLAFHNEDAVQQSIQLLRRIHPLTHNATIKKSQLHHALAELMTRLLWPLVREDRPGGRGQTVALRPQVMASWNALILQLKDDVWAWMQKHDKHTRVGWPLAVTLVCLLDSEQYSNTRDAAADFFLRQLKNKDWRGLALRCLAQMVTSLLVRYGQIMPRPEINKWLDKVYRGSGQKDAPCLLGAAKKGYFNHNEMAEMLSPVAELVPDYTTGLIIDLLQSDLQECQLIGLRVMHSMLLLTPTLPPQELHTLLDRSSILPPPAPCAAPHAASAAGGAWGGSTPPPAPATATWGGQGGESGQQWCGAVQPGQASGGGLGGRQGAAWPGGVWVAGAQPGMWGMHSSSSSSSSSGGGGVGGAGVGAGGSTNGVLGELMRRGLHPVDVLGLGHLLPRLTAALSRVWQQCHVAWGGGGAFLASDSGFKDRQLHLHVFCCLLMLVPLTKPEVWQPARPLEMLPGYLTHQEVAIHTAAREALHSLVLTCPLLRNAVLNAVASHAAGLPDDNPVAVRDTLAVLRSLAKGWASCLRARAAGESQERSGPDALLLDLHRLEGVGLAVGLCHWDEGVRVQALKLLDDLRALHQAMVAADPYTPPPPPAAYTLNPLALATNRRGQGAMTAEQGPSGGGISGLVSNLSAHGPRGLMDLVEKGVTYLVDLVEQAGPDLVAATYWDVGEWAACWVDCKEAPEGLELQAVLVAGTGDDTARLRLARLLMELAKLAARVTPLTAAAALQELTAGRLARLLQREPSGRLTLPLEGLDRRRVEAWRLSCCLAVALPAGLRDKLMERLAHCGTAGAGQAGGGLPGSIPHSGSAPSLGNLMRPSRPVGATGQVSTRELLRLLLGLASGAAAAFGSACTPLTLSSLMALGLVHEEHVEVLLEEIAPVTDEYASSRPTKAKSTLLGLLMTTAAGTDNTDSSRQGGRSKADEARRVVAQVFCLLTRSAPQSLLISRTRPGLRWRLLEWVRDCFLHLKEAALGSELLWDNVQVAYSLSCVIHHVAGPLSAALNQPLAAVKDLPRGSGLEAPHASWAATRHAAGTSFRKALFEMLAGWSDDGPLPAADYHHAVRIGIAASLSKFKVEPDQLEPLRQELLVAAAYLDLAARRARAALLVGPVFDADTKRPQGQVLLWVDRMLTCSPGGKAARSRADPSLATNSFPQGMRAVGCDLPRKEVARQALLNLLQSNVDELFYTCLDKCYDVNREVANTYFQVVSQVYTTSFIRCKPYIMISLILYKMVDSISEVREDARSMFWVLTRRELSMLSEEEYAAVVASEQASPSWGPARSGRVGNAGGLQGQFARALSLQTRPKAGTPTVAPADSPGVTSPVTKSGPEQSGQDAGPGLAQGLHSHSLPGGPSLGSPRSGPLKPTPAAAPVARATTSVNPPTTPFVLGVGMAPGPGVPTGGAARPPRPGGGGGAGGPVSGGMSDYPHAGAPSAPESARSSLSGRHRDTEGGGLVRGTLGGSAPLRLGGEAGGQGAGGEAGAGGPGGCPGLAAFLAEAYPGGHIKDVDVFGNLQDSYQQVQDQLTAHLAKEHPELSEELCQEMMTRALECQERSIQHPVLLSLRHWMANLSILTQWKGTWCERLLKSMYYVTQRHGSSFPEEIQTLWATLVDHHGNRNIAPILDFLVSLGMHAALQDLSSLVEYFSVARRIALFLSRRGPQHTIDCLVAEVQKQLQEDDGSAQGSAGGSGQASGPTQDFNSLLGESYSPADALLLGGGQSGSWPQDLDPDSLALPPPSPWGEQQQQQLLQPQPQQQRGGQLHDEADTQPGTSPAPQPGPGGLTSPDLLHSPPYTAWAHLMYGGAEGGGLPPGPPAAAAAAAAAAGQVDSVGTSSLAASNESGLMAQQQMAQHGGPQQQAGAAVTGRATGGISDAGSIATSFSVEGGSAQPGGVSSGLARMSSAASSSSRSSFTGGAPSSFNDSALGLGGARLPAGLQGVSRADSFLTPLSLVGPGYGSSTYRDPLPFSPSPLPPGSSAGSTALTINTGQPGLGAQGRGGQGGQLQLPGFVNMFGSGGVGGQQQQQQQQPSPGKASQGGVGGQLAGTWSSPVGLQLPGGASGGGGAGGQAYVGLLLGEEGGGGPGGGGGGGGGGRGGAEGQTLGGRPSGPAVYGAAPGRRHTNSIHKALVTRAELSVCLLSEIAYELDTDFEPHLAVLLHVATLLMDCEEPLVALAARQLMLNLVYSISSYQYYTEQADGNGACSDLSQAAGLVRHLQAAVSVKRLWAYEDASLSCPQPPSTAVVYGMVDAVVQAMSYAHNLQDAWAEVALIWALHSRSRHLSGRSLQVFRALHPELTADLVATLLLSLLQCFSAQASASLPTAFPSPPLAAAGSRVGSGVAAPKGGVGCVGGPPLSVCQDCAVEVLVTLQALVEDLQPASRMVLYPQLFWAALGLLHTPCVALYACGLQLLEAILRSLKLHQAKVANVLLAAAPGAPGHVMLTHAVGQLGSSREQGGAQGREAGAGNESPESWALGLTLLQLHRYESQPQVAARYSPLAVQQLLLKGLAAPTTSAATLRLLTSLADVLAVQGHALHGLLTAGDLAAVNADGPGGGSTPRPAWPGLVAAAGAAEGGLVEGGEVKEFGSGGAAAFHSLRQHRLLRLDAHQALLGPWRCQLLVSCLGVLPYLVLAHSPGLPGSSHWLRDSEPAAALSTCLRALGSAATAHRLPLLGDALARAAAWPAPATPLTLAAALRGVCGALASAFFPRYALLFLHHSMDCLARPAPPAMHMATCQLLVATFAAGGEGGAAGGGQQQGALLGPVALSQILNTKLLAPLVDKTQGALQGPASEALRVILDHVAACQRSASAATRAGNPAPASGRASRADGRRLDSSSSSLASLESGGISHGHARSPHAHPQSPAVESQLQSAFDLRPGQLNYQPQQLGAQAEPPQGQGAYEVITLRTLHPPPGSVALAIRRVIESMGSAARRNRRATKLLPFLNPQQSVASAGAISVDGC